MNEVKITQEQLDELFAIKQQIEALNKKAEVILLEIGSPRPPHEG